MNLLSLAETSFLGRPAELWAIFVIMVLVLLVLDLFVLNRKDKAQDFKCGPRSYDDHKGTDFAVRDRSAIEKDVFVLAAADGTVTRFRDGEEDAFRNLAEQAAIRTAKKDCGNGIMIDHGNGWQTQYCHLKKGSIAVAKDQTVRAGQKIAAIGLSGITDHPHLHISVLHKDQTIDPFTGKSITSGCNQDPQPLWIDRMPYEDFALYDGGFSVQAPDFAAISQGRKPPSPIRESKSGVFWFVYFGARQGDRIALTVKAPDGTVFAEHSTVQDKDKARQYYFTGRNLSHGFPARGTYKGEARVSRIGPDGETKTQSITRELVIE